MSIIAREPESNYTPCPEGLYPAVCVDVVDLGLVVDQWGSKHKVKLVWQVDEANEDTGQRHRVSKRYNNSLHEKASLRKDLESWRGRKFTVQELQGFDLETLLEVNCQIQVVHHITDDGKTYANVQAIIAAPKNATKLRPLDYTREKDRPTDGNGYQDQAPPPDDDDEIPFAWLLPLLATVGGYLVA